MKKCPRCQYEIKDEDKYCPHCGLDLQNHYRPIRQKKHSKPISYLLYGSVLISIMTIPLLYSYFLSGLSQNMQNPIANQDNTALPELQKGDAMYLIQSFDTLTDYNQKYSNVSTYVDHIQDYEQTLFSKCDYTFDKAYLIQVLDNYNVLYKLTYTTQINDQYKIEIIREFDRSHTYNREIISLKKCDVQTFEELVFQDNEIEIMNQFVEDSSIQKVIHDFSLREDEFEKQKEKLGHYGMGTYEKKASFVVKRFEKTYTSECKYQHDVKDYIG